MGFKENLKARLAYKGMLVKELAALSGIKKHTIDNYLNTHNAMPSAESAVAIARVLDVSVEYLVTGEEAALRERHAFSGTVRSILGGLEALDDDDCRIVLALVEALRRRQRKNVGGVSVPTD
jgi:transcriptional regulator with XRE-family HTH domain